LVAPSSFRQTGFPTVTVVVEATCADAVRSLGLIKDVAPVAPDSSDTDRLMAQARRAGPAVALPTSHA
jgi:hypothetical protein